MVAPIVISSTDSAKGYDTVTFKSMTSLDASTGLEASRAKIPVTDLGLGAEFLRLVVATIERGLSRELVSFTRKETCESAKGGDVVSWRRVEAVDASRGAELSLPTLFTAIHPRDVLSSCIAILDNLYQEVDYGKEVKTTHFNQPVDCVLLALNLVNYELQKLVKIGVRLGDEIYREVIGLWDRATRWRRLRSGDIIEPEHENEIIDMLTELEEIYRKLLRYRFLKVSELGVGIELARYKDLTAVADRLRYKPTPIEYYTDSLSPAGGYVLTPPPITFKEAYTTHFTGITMLIYNVSKGTRILWTDVWQGKPSCYVYVYSDCWVVTWFEDLTFYSTPDWDYDDVAVGARIEVLDGKRYVHFVAFEKGHLDTDRCCIVVGGVEYCTGNLGAYSGAVRIAYEAWISL